jgi:hypothetical protein
MVCLDNGTRGVLPRPFLASISCGSQNYLSADYKKGQQLWNGCVDQGTQVQGRSPENGRLNPGSATGCDLEIVT